MPPPPAMTSKHNRRMMSFRKAGLYFVTSQSLSNGRTTIAIVNAALAAGAKLIQLREKEMPLKEFVALAHLVRKRTLQNHALLIINDRIDVAMAVGADGVHLGQDDFPIDEARRIAPDMIIGASAHSVSEARDAQKRGASYVNIGPLFPTKTKSWDRRFLGLRGLRQISPHLSVPFTVMGGIKREHIPDLLAAGARTIAVVTAITMAKDPKASARELLSMIAPGTGRRR
jgi:thiamine-phosphate pyrophosphorylase